MFTVTMGRTLSALSLVAAVASTSAAQIVVRTEGAGIAGGGVNVLTHRLVQISDDSVRSYLSRFEPGVLDDASGDANIVTMVLDSDGAYVRSTARHAKMIQATPGQVVTVNGDSVRAIAVGSNGVISINGDSARAMRVSGFGETRVIGVGGSVVAVNGMDRANVGGAFGMLADVSPSEIGAISTKRYAAGEMGTGPVIVTFVYLK